ncbi:FAD-dependent oxidoreductase [Lipingzhangella sp. LS1_29]|uniref:FAD-dependent oxidoreductase n=1 Tax=Lipingzhangella rawalii TaxID=2055835 RepID=A0ABU2H6J1_9ACTN|nr:FAD-dependent oxidoreductase [Lipingzhangella rawalii]MDS1270927.1 FAD-dependent oxidoreductase [Lipingzhangella rawalii]
MLLRSQLRLACGITAPNRLLFGPHRTNLGSAEGRGLSAEHVAYYHRRAAGGAGVVVTETASVHPEDWPYAQAPLASACPQGWSAIAEACHAEGALAVAALGHAGAQGSSAHSQAALWAPSPVPDAVTREVPKAMSVEEIAAVVTGFADAARRAARAGMSGVEVDAGQQSLLRQFLSPLTNQRTDDYGSPDRCRFVREILRAVRTALGPGRVLGLRLSCDELADTRGITVDAASELARDVHADLTAAGGLDYLVATRGSGDSLAAAQGSRPDGHGPTESATPLAPRIRAAIQPEVAVCAQGGIVDPEQAEGLLVEGSAEVVEMTRAQIADAELGTRLHGFAPDAEADSPGPRPRPCVLCNQHCRVDYPRAPAVSCMGDPSSGHETDPEEGVVSLALPAPPAGADRSAPGTVSGPRQPTPLTEEATGTCQPDGNGTPDEDTASPAPPAQPVEVLVIGAGPAGLETARVAATAGHAVRVVERADRTGGMLRVAAAGHGRHRLARLADWLHTECEQLGVTITTGYTAADRDIDAQLATGGAVVLCSGGRPGRIGYRVGAGVRRMDDAALLGLLASGAEPPHGPVAVYDRVGGPVALSIVEELAAREVAVTLVTPDHAPAMQLAPVGALSPAALRLARLGVPVQRRQRVLGAGNGRIQLEGVHTGEVCEVDAAVLVDCGFRLPADQLWHGTRLGMDRAGDVIAPRGVQEAILDGRRAAKRLQEVRLW